VTEATEGIEVIATETERGTEIEGAGRGPHIHLGIGLGPPLGVSVPSGVEVGVEVASEPKHKGALPDASRTKTLRERRFPARSLPRRKDRSTPPHRRVGGRDRDRDPRLDMDGGRRVRRDGIVMGGMGVMGGTTGRGVGIRGIG
jgi:hypothetical protein